MMKRICTIVLFAALALSTGACGLFQDPFSRFADEFEGATSYTMAMTVTIPSVGSVVARMEVDANKTHVGYPNQHIEYYTEENEIKQWKYVYSSSQGYWYRLQASADDLDRGAFAPLGAFAKADFTEDATGIYTLSADRLSAYGVSSLFFTMDDFGNPVATLSMTLDDIDVIAVITITAVGETVVTLPSV